ncbi:MAG: FtsX-like permease family protein [Candidatus Pacebacteria bacterium]|jgi:ABC-type antimicrobial peptide transport system permease subunit|nr:FtsX-like permease family protein [Candidatus Paceibacterota bacterium]MBT6401689.1 FtsX-like permease family protein [candidate division WWE3 bacterium]MBT7349583.1 FtsX-like permease family protein [candidate division WWE3 bacterium]
MTRTKPILKLKLKLRRAIASSWKMASFTCLLILYLITEASGFIERRVRKLFRRPAKTQVGWLARRWQLIYSKAIKILDSHRDNSISRIDLIELSVRNLKAKKTRTVVTIGGMAIGIGAIVFLVSIGYGLQDLVVSRVTRLEEMRQASVSPQTGSKLRLNDKALSDFTNFPEITSALPVITAVGKISYQSSVTDVAVYGVTADYLHQSAIKPLRGKIFDNNQLISSTKDLPGQVAGISTEKKVGEIGGEINQVEYLINPGVWVRVRNGPSTDAEILGYTKRVEGYSQATEVWGEEYLTDDNAGTAGFDEEGNTLGKWLQAGVLLWQKQECNIEESGDCEGGKYMVDRDEDGTQVQAEGYMGEIGLTIEYVNLKPGQVLGITDETDEASNTQGIDWVEIASESAIVAETKLQQIELSPDAAREAVVNQAMVSVLGLDENEAVGKTFSASFVVVGELLDNQDDKIESVPADYTIVGVIPEGKNPIFYIPFIDLRSLGITNYSQAKISTETQKGLPEVRQKIEAMGYVTQSVADTVSQINSLFSTARSVFALLGMVALAVAALGMFNTLTVSLLERTREVGLMKAMGMRSEEVKELFLTESMVMGFYGGILGIVLGVVAGKFLSLILTIFALSRGAGVINISHVPFYFIVLIAVLSLGVGIATGIYPARRATKISALNALRYE